MPAEIEGNSAAAPPGRSARWDAQLSFLQGITKSILDSGALVGGNGFKDMPLTVTQEPLAHLCTKPFSWQPEWLFHGAFAKCSISLQRRGR